MTKEEEYTVKAYAYEGEKSKGHPGRTSEMFHKALANLRSGLKVEGGKP